MDLNEIYCQPSKSIVILCETDVLTHLYGFIIATEIETNSKEIANNGIPCIITTFGKIKRFFATF